MNHSIPLALLLGCSLLGACSDKAAPVPAQASAITPPAPAVPQAATETAPAADGPVAAKNDEMKTPEARARDSKLEAAMMLAIFGKNYRPDSDDALADLPDPDSKEAKADKLSYVVSAVSHKLLPDGRAILVANAETANTEGTAESAHASPGLLNVFYLAPKGKPGDESWQVVTRLENIATLGSSGQLGDVHWVSLGAGKQGLAIRHGYTGQGYTITQLALFEIGAGKVTELDGGIDLHSDNEGACGPETDNCWLVDGNWHFAAARDGGAYDDLLIDFTGASRKIKPGVQVKEDQEPPRLVTQMNGHARYAFDGKKYKLVEGKNIVPEV
ncbi:hypothetical protein [Janthinobacterium sp. J1-1]|uniref:hypothetical protein n=1 Tax=Janthinobacterium sp. J1-1 TaxID=3065910 RepID=UPI0028127968|nr:hypothetical protein [Janthinobacterium sp. J1-1]